MMFYITQIFTVLLYLQNLQIVESAKSKKKHNWYSIISKFSHQNGLPSSLFTASFGKLKFDTFRYCGGMHNRLSKKLLWDSNALHYILRTYNRGWIGLVMKLIKVQERPISLLKFSKRTAFSRHTTNYQAWREQMTVCDLLQDYDPAVRPSGRTPYNDTSKFIVFV